MGRIEEATGALKPSRSEAGQLLSEEEQAKYAQQVQDFLQSTTPVRPLKPSRSDLEENIALRDGLVNEEDYCKAEVARFKALEADGQVLPFLLKNEF
jgi:hypothetical protein